MPAMKIWVPSKAAVDVLSDLPDVECAVYDGTEAVPRGAEEVEVWVPPLLPVARLPELLARMPRLRLLQTVTAGVDPYRPHLPEGVTLCNARGVHDAGTAEWAVGAMIAVLREFPGFAAAQRGRRVDLPPHRRAGRLHGADHRLRLDRRGAGAAAGRFRGGRRPGGQDRAGERARPGRAAGAAAQARTWWCCWSRPPPRPPASWTRTSCRR